MKYTVTLVEGQPLTIEAESFHGGSGTGLVIFIDGCALPVAAVQAHNIQSIKTDAVTEESK